MKCVYLLVRTECGYNSIILVSMNIFKSCFYILLCILNVLYIIYIITPRPHSDTCIQNIEEGLRSPSLDCLPPLSSVEKISSRLPS